VGRTHASNQILAGAAVQLQVKSSWEQLQVKILQREEVVGCLRCIVGKRKGKVKGKEWKLAWALGLAR
jgi:hypothetical protein